MAGDRVRESRAAKTAAMIIAAGALIFGAAGSLFGAPDAGLAALKRQYGVLPGSPIRLPPPVRPNHDEHAAARAGNHRECHAASRSHGARRVASIPRS